MNIVNNFFQDLTHGKNTLIMKLFLKKLIHKKLIVNLPLGKTDNH
jgi:hypothetical protein